MPRPERPWGLHLILPCHQTKRVRVEFLDFLQWLNFWSLYIDWIYGVSTLIEFLESLHWLIFWSLYIDWFSEVSTLFSGFLGARAPWLSSTRSGRTLAWTKTRLLTSEKQSLKGIDFCLAILMTHSQTMKWQLSLLMFEIDRTDYYFANVFAQSLLYMSLFHW